ncbi:hypothetical protein WDU99_13500 [Microbacterium sp. Mu-80]|uniref:Uncharacterized protein n=1 Tax=Microbacterium bandirmense TaxID=3122050 RepID=A0ABU8LDC6_9MICO
MRITAARRAALCAAAAFSVIVTAGCGPAPWADEQTAPPSSPPPTASAPVPNDLSGGSTQRELSAGAVSAEIEYWSTLSMDRWDAGAVKPISFSLVTTITPDDGQKVYLQKASMLVVPGNADATFPPLEVQADVATVAPGYLVSDPYSYSQTFNVGPVDPDATFVTVQFTYDFLAQTTPTSKEYAKQTASDSLTIAIAR